MRSGCFFSTFLKTNFENPLPMSAIMTLFGTLPVDIYWGFMRVHDIAWEFMRISLDFMEVHEISCQLMNISWEFVRISCNFMGVHKFVCGLLFKRADEVS